MTFREKFRKTYDNPVRQNYVASAQLNKPIVGLGTWFKDDDRNMGGKNIIQGQHQNHKVAIKQVTSVIAEEMKPPHAHITKVVNGKTDFGRDKKRRRKKSLRSYTGNTILTRQMKNIDPVLHQQDDFREVIELKKRVRGVSSGQNYFIPGGCAVDNHRPETFKLAKKLTENRHPNQFAISEHVRNLASLQRRLNSVNNKQMRQKNMFDPLANPVKFRRPGAIPHTASLPGLTKRLTKHENQMKERVQQLESKIVSKALSAAGRSQSPSPQRAQNFNNLSYAMLQQDASEHKRNGVVSHSYDFHGPQNLATQGSEVIGNVQVQKIKDSDSDLDDEPHVVEAKTVSDSSVDPKGMTRWRTEAGTIDSVSNHQVATAHAMREASGAQALAQQSTNSSFHTAAAQRPRTGRPPNRNNAFFTASPHGDFIPLNNDVMLNIGISNQTLGQNTARNNGDLTTLLSRKRQKSSRNRQKQRQMSDFAILNRVRVRRNNQANTMRTLDLYTHGPQTSQLSPMNQHGQVVMPHTLISPQNQNFLMRQNQNAMVQLNQLNAQSSAHITNQNPNTAR